MRGQASLHTLLEAETLIIVNHMVRLALLARPGRPCGPPAEERARSSIKYYIGQQTHYSLEACCSDTSLIELLWR